MLQRTTIYPDQDPLPVMEEPILKLIVLSNDMEIVKNADNLAQSDPTSIGRWVIWMQQKDNDMLETLLNEVPNNVDEVVAFALSTVNLVADAILDSEEVDYLRLDEAFTKAGLPEFNPDNQT